MKRRPLSVVTGNPVEQDADIPSKPNFISIKTGLPIDGSQARLKREKTLRSMIDIISIEVGDSNSEYFSLIQHYIDEAIQFCERERFYFNESREITFPTVSGRSEYDISDSSHIETGIGIKSIYISGDTVHKTALVRENGLTVDEWLTNGAVGVPSHYAFFNNKLYLNPSPDSVYSLRLVLSPYRIGEIMTLDEESPWLTHAFYLIKARAKYEFYKNIIKDPQEIEWAYADFKEQLSALRRETTKRDGLYIIKPTSF